MLCMTPQSSGLITCRRVKSSLSDMHRAAGLTRLQSRAQRCGHLTTPALSASQNRHVLTDAKCFPNTSPRKTLLPWKPSPSSPKPPDKFVLCACTKLANGSPWTARLIDIHICAHATASVVRARNGWTEPGDVHTSSGLDTWAWFLARQPCTRQPLISYWYGSPQSPEHLSDDSSGFPFQLTGVSVSGRPTRPSGKQGTPTAKTCNNLVHQSTSGSGSGSLILPHFTMHTSLRKL